MRYAIILCVTLLLGCDDEDLPGGFYANGEAWKPVVPVRSPGGSVPRDLREWDRYFSASGIQADQFVKKFTPTWVGFSADPVGDISYLDFGKIVVLWRDTALLGTSDLGSMALSGLPEAIRPASGKVVKCFLQEGTDVIDGSALVNDNGVVNFGASDTTTVPGRVVYSSNFATSGDKGLPAGFFLQYTKDEE